MQFPQITTHLKYVMHVLNQEPIVSDVSMHPFFVFSHTHQNSIISITLAH